MTCRRTLLSASILAGLTFAGALYAEEAPAPAAAAGAAQTPDGAAAAAGAADAPQDETTSNSTQMETIVVRGIRESLKRSLETKRDADAIIDAITAEDIGKFPSTNVAEAMAQIPGVTIDRRFGQGERVSINGTDPSLNLTFLDGHPVAETTWLYGEQPNRGFDYTLLAPEILGKLEVYKSSEARLPEGSIGGTVFMHTREPLGSSDEHDLGLGGRDVRRSVRRDQAERLVPLQLEESGKHVRCSVLRSALRREGRSPGRGDLRLQPGVESVVESGRRRGHRQRHAEPERPDAAGNQRGVFPADAQARQRHDQPAVEAERPARIRREGPLHPRELQQLQPVDVRLHQPDAAQHHQPDAWRQRPHHRRTFVRQRRSDLSRPRRQRRHRAGQYLPRQPGAHVGRQDLRPRSHRHLSRRRLGLERPGRLQQVEQHRQRAGLHRAVLQRRLLVGYPPRHHVR